MGKGSGEIIRPSTVTQKMGISNRAENFVAKARPKNRRNRMTLVTSIRRQLRHKK